jgi:hypothetical protein
LTVAANPRRALEAVLSASRAGCALSDRSSARAVIAAPRLSEAKVLASVDRAAVGLLGRLLMLRPPKGTPIYQFAACSAGENAADVAAALAYAAAVLVGRTLLIRSNAPLTGRVHPAIQADRPLSDAFLPGLYHFKMDAGIETCALLNAAARPEGLAAMASQFRVVVVESCDCAASVALAPECTGTVLVVRAGRTSVAAARAAAAWIEAAGGQILGTVLCGAATPKVAR